MGEEEVTRSWEENKSGKGDVRDKLEKSSAFIDKKLHRHKVIGGLGGKEVAR